MKFWYNEATRKKISDADYKKLSPEEQSKCRPWTETPPGKKPGKQDYDWYNIDDVISEAVGNIPYNRFTGTRETSSISISANSNANWRVNAQPGILTIKFIPSMGESHSAVSALNTASRSVYSWVRHQNSGRTNYEAPDLMIYLGAMTQVYEAFYEATRIYGAAMTFLHDNRYIGRGILQAANVNISDVVGNLAQFRYGLNILASKISSLCVPAKFTLFRRHAFIARNVFTDSSSTRGQLYMFQATHHLQFSATASENGGSLQAVKSWFSEGAPVSYTTILSHIDGLVEAVLQDEDMGIMSGDILKAYGRENLYTLEFVSEDMTVDLRFNEDVLQQIENAFSYGGIDSSSKPNVYSITQSGTPSSEGDRYLITNEYGLQAGDLYYTGQHTYFNSHKDSPTYKDNIEWARDNCSEGYDSEFIVGFQIYENCYNKDLTEETYLKFDFGSCMLAATSQINDYFIILDAYSKFDWAPMLYIFTGTTTLATFVAVFADLKVYTLVEKVTIALIHEASAQGLLGKLTMSAT